MVVPLIGYVERFSGRPGSDVTGCDVRNLSSASIYLPIIFSTGCRPFDGAAPARSCGTRASCGGKARPPNFAPLFASPLAAE
jgi:hypothetical protein